ncbi:MAG: hypothetical protein Q9169_007517 [Polycauliona sp. 2 TL-2023]
MFSYQSLAARVKVDDKSTSMVTRNRLARYRRPDPNILTPRQQQLAQILSSTDADSTNFDATELSNLIHPFLSYFEQELQDRLEHYYQPVLDYCCFPPTVDKAQSMVDMTKKIAVVMKDPKERFKGGREISMNMVLNAISTSNGTDKTASKAIPPVDVKQGMFSLLGFLTMLFEIPKDCSDKKLCISKPEDPYILIMEIEDQPQSVLADANRSMFREALLSYRLLFGQDIDSRWLFDSHEKKRASKGGYTDLLLVQLCSQSKNTSKLMNDQACYEQAFYDSVIDFPHYGRRLEILQRYISTKKSRTVKDLWYDRRDPEKWVLIWIVLMLTVVTILLSLVQIGLGVSQVRLAQVQVRLAELSLVQK